MIGGNAVGDISDLLGQLFFLFFFKVGKEGVNDKQMKMLEICLKLVGCKSKKGLSSSSSCYLEGECKFAALGGLFGCCF